MYKGKNLFGDRVLPETIELFIFADEKKKVNNRWDYIGMVLIPADKMDEALKLLNRAREKVKYYNSLKFAKINKKGKGQIFGLSREWLNIILDDGKYKRGIFYFNVLGIDTQNLDFSYFGEGCSSKGKYANVYNRFFRTTFLSSIKYFFPNYNKIVIKGIFHDTEGNLEEHQYFDWHLIWKIGRDNKDIIFQEDRIYFINDNHNEELSYPDYSHFVQLIDIIIGTISFCFDFPNRANKGKILLAQHFLPLVKEIIYEREERESYYGYARKYSISFFPSETLKLGNVKLGGMIYKDRPIIIENRSAQQKLF